MKTTHDTTNWNLLVSVAEQRLEECGRRLAKLLARREEAYEKLNSLLEYRRNYQVQLEGAQRNGITADGLRNFQSFVATLERATEQQSDLLAALQKLLYDCEAEVGALQRKIHSYRVLQERRSADAKRQDHRRQQALQDEMAARMRVAG
jgi:flagellar FliJ protein